MLIGPYEVKARLGRGGMGEVLLAQHTTEGTLVAIKRALRLDAGQIASLRREIYALSRLHHPNIVRLVDHGTIEGLPWCALEYVDGETLQAVLEPPDVGPTRPVAATPTTATIGTLDATAPRADSLPVLTGRKSRPLVPPAPHVTERCLVVARRLCEPLAFLHGEGIVHCDLKPANVVLRPDGTPVIIDFGLMVHFSGPHGRERLDEGFAAIGTFEYMAPERIRRELVDARADLYALGCILYEMLTGRPPFVGEHGLILRQHVTQKPAPPSHFVPTVSPEMDELVLRLLEKDPRARIGYADTVAAALDALGVAGDARDVRQPSSRSRAAHAAPRARAYLYRPAFAGHAPALRNIVTEPGGLVVVGAESGAGKTRFALEAGRVLAGEMRVVTCECLPIGTERGAVLGAPLHPLVPLLRAIADECRSQGPGMTEILLGRRGRVLADYEPVLLELPEVAELPPPARLSPEAAHQRLFSDLAETLFAFSMLQRVVLILDDLQWADELTLGFLATLTPTALEDQGVLVIATYRTDEASPAVRALAEQPGARRVDLARLDHDAVGSIARDMLALPDTPEALVDWLSACSAGNPFFVAEYLRSMVEQGLLARDTLGRWAASPALGTAADLRKLPVPGSVRDLLEARLDSLTPSARAWAAAAAVLGREIDLDVLERVARPEDAAPPDSAAAPSSGRGRVVAIEELLARQILEELPRGFRFVHDMLREVAYERLPSARKKALHLAAARAIEDVYAARRQLPTTYAALAHHYGAADVVDKTFHYLELAAESALESGAYAQARAFLERLLLLDGARGRPAAALTRARWNRWLAEAARALGDLAGLGEHTARGLAELGRPLPRTPLGWAGAFTSALARQVASFAAKRAAFEPSPAGPAPTDDKRVAFKPSPAAAAPTLGERAAFEPSSAPTDDERAARAEAAQMTTQLAFRYYFAGDAAGMMTASLLAVDAAESAARGASPDMGLPRGLSRPYAYLGYLAGLARMHPVAHAYFDQAAEASRRANDPDGAALALTTQAVYELCLCRWPAAERAAQEALAIQIANANALEAELLHTILGHVEFFTARFEASRRRFEALAAAARRRHHEQHAAWGLYATARCHLAEGRPEAALPLLRGAEALLAKISDEASELIVDGLHAQAHLALGDLPAALDRAARVARRVDRLHVPTVFSTVHAYVALAEVRLAAWERGDRSMRWPALRACAALSAFAALFPLGRPAARRCAALSRALLGQREAALRDLERSAETATQLGMPFECDLARRQLARLRA